MPPKTPKFISDLQTDGAIDKQLIQLMELCFVEGWLKCMEAMASAAAEEEEAA